LLSCGAVAGPDLQLGAVRGVAARVIEAQSRLGVEQRAIGTGDGTSLATCPTLWNPDVTGLFLTS